MSNAGARPSARGVRGCRDRLRESGVARCGLLGLVGEGYGPCGRPAPPGAHVGRVLRLCGVTRGMVVRRTTGRGRALTPSEQTKGQ